MTADQVRFALIGTGRIGQVHAASIAANPDATLTLVYDPVVEGAQAVTQRYGGVVASDLEAVFSSADVDAVLIASPTPTHIDLIDRAVDAGIPALCEKPIDLDIARVDALRSKVEVSAVPIALGFNRRFDAGFASARARVAAGEIGTLEHLSIISRDPAPPPAEYVGMSGGIFRDMTIHDFDMARFFVPDIVEVFATGSSLFDAGAREHGDFDSAVVVLRAASGALVTITNSRHSAIGYDQRIEAFGARGMLQVENAGTSLVSVSTADAVEAKRPYQDFFLERYAGAYAAELDEFIKLVRGAPSTSPTFADGRAALMLADAAARSAAERVVVRVRLD
ncbi:MAG TPA: inositol 2-dehydrogenase [Agromyces sp.]|nr:inositol 2-dehydrogenase [Agromyces sp.]